MIARSFKILIALTLFVLAWLLAFGNNQTVSLAFMAWTTPALPLFIWLLVTLFLGIIIGLILGRFSKRKRSGSA